ncbi:hypothetical protein SNR26_03285 [Pectobacterium brasiliense]|uniref:hypothetical protein n=1 Tax=Pectobacterium brasiliense TaxID=180957 RepID=UPI002A80024D|nr:hypothetical protein [Pectobacterium brasiliense]MDY4367131.1 hypothetical protein [Pectobacterium brasiliense]MDY7056268.1 hypothetical protein [Pectobacterium brasiliense]
MITTEQANSHSNELKNNINESVRVTLRILLALYMIELLRDPKKNIILLKTLKTKTYWDELFYSHFSLLYQEHSAIILKKHDLPSDYISDIVEGFENDTFAYEIDILNDVINALELDIKSDIKNNLSIELSFSDNKIDVYSGIIDFLLEYHNVMSDVLDCIESGNSKNKESMLYMTMASFARTLTSYVEDCSKPLVCEIVKFSNLKFLRLLKGRKNVDDELKETIKTISKKGLGNLNYLLKTNLDFPSKNNPGIYEKHKSAADTFKKFVESRNKIIHNFKPNESDFIFVINNWNTCLDFYSEILTEYTQDKGFEIFFNTLFDEAKQCAQNQNLMVKRVFPLFEAYM